MIPASVPSVTAELFARIPPRWTAPRPSAWAHGVLGRSEIGSFLEGPAFDRSGTLYVSDLAHQRIFRIDPAGEVDVLVEYDGRPNGLAVHRDGGLFVADYAKGLLRIDPDSGKIETVLAGYRLEPFRGLSDLVFGPDGALYFSDQGQSDLRDPSGRVFRLGPDGGVQLLMDGIASPNGMALSPDGSMLYVAVTRANCVHRLPLRRGGRLGKVGVHVYSGGGTGGPDGLAVSVNGGLAIAQFGSGRVWLVDDDGLLVGSVRSTDGKGVTNVAYGGPDGRSLYLTEAESGSVLVARLPTPGTELYSHGER